MRFHLFGICLVGLLAAGSICGQAQQPESAQSKQAADSVRSAVTEGDGYIYVSGQSGNRSDGTLPNDFVQEASQSLENIKSLLTSSSLGMENVVYIQVHLLDVGNYRALNDVFKKYFSSNAPAGAVLGVARIPQGSIQISAIAVRDLAGRKTIVPAKYKLNDVLSPGVLTKDRLFVSAMRGRDLESGKVPEDPAEQTDLALDGLKAVAETAGLSMKHFVFINPFLTLKIPTKIMNEHYASRFEFGNTPARATIMVSALPQDSQIEYTGIAVRDLKLRRSIRPKNMPPSPTASPCVFAGETLYCSAKSGFIPGPNGGVYGPNAPVQLRQSMRNQLDNLEEADMDLNDVVSTTVYLDNLSDTEAYDKVYRQYFKDKLPARTILQQIPPTNRATDAEGHYPDVEQFSLVAVKRPPKK